MSNKPLMLELLTELAQSPGSFSSSVLGHVQTSTPNTDVNKNSKFSGRVAYENEEISKINQARSMLKTMLSGDDFDRQAIISQLMSTLNVTLETATSYFQRIAKEMGVTAHKRGSGDSGGSGGSSGSSSGGMEADPTPAGIQSHAPFAASSPVGNSEATPGVADVTQLDDNQTMSDTPDRQGAIRTIKNAHLVYKRQNAEGTYDELWIYNIQSDISDELEVRRNILAGTDIPPKKQSSDDGTQSYRLTTLGNAQMLMITGLTQ